MNGEAMTSSFSLEGRSELQHMLSDTELADQQSYSGVGCEYRHVEGRAEMEEEEEEAGGLRAGPKSWEGGSALTGSGAGPEAGLELLEAGELSCDAESEDGPEVKKVGRGSRPDTRCRKGSAWRGKRCPGPVQKGPSRVDGALQCLQLRKEKILGTLPSLAVAKELARCMHEPKFHTLRSTIDQLGLDRTVQLFHETAQIQEAGGILSVEGKKKAPGGVFFALLKKTASSEQLNLIFEKEKVSTRLRKKRHNWRRKELKRNQMAQSTGEDLKLQLDHTRLQEGAAASSDADLRNRLGHRGSGEASAASKVDSGVTFMEVDEEEMVGGSDSVVLEGGGSDSVVLKGGGSSDSVVLERKGNIMMSGCDDTSSSAAVRDFEASNDVDLDPAAFILLD